MRAKRLPLGQGGGWGCGFLFGRGVAVNFVYCFVRPKAMGDRTDLLMRLRMLQLLDVRRPAFELCLFAAVVNVHCDQLLTRAALAAAPLLQRASSAVDSLFVRIGAFAAPTSLLPPAPADDDAALLEQLQALQARLLQKGGATTAAAAAAAAAAATVVLPAPAAAVPAPAAAPRGGGAGSRAAPPAPAPSPPRQVGAVHAMRRAAAAAAFNEAHI
jgi:hypothetical protein